MFFTAILLSVALFMAGLFAVSTDVGRRHIGGGTWLVAAILALLFIAHVGQFGPMEDPLLDNPVDLVLMVLVAVGSFLWSVRAGGPTEELAEILAAQAQRDRAAHSTPAPRTGPPSPTTRSETTGS